MRGEMSLWMLTKFGMIFFIVALSAIVFSVELRAKDSICKDQSNAIAQAISSRITQVLESPAEDEQRTYAFPGGLSLGRSDRVRYLVQVTDRRKAGAVDEGRLIVNVSPSSGQKCEGASSVPYKGFAVKLIQGPRPLDPPTGNPQTLTFSPSDLTYEKKSFYMVAIKCASKTTPPGAGQPRFLYVQDCTHENVIAPPGGVGCLSITSDPPDPDIESNCGFPP